MSPEDVEESPATGPRQEAAPPVDADDSQLAGQELGRVERPPAEQFQGMRRLLLLPLMFEPPAEPDGEPSEGQAIYERYWEQARTQVDALTARLNGLHHIYHESMVEGGEEGLAYLQMASPRIYALVQVRCLAGAVLEATESVELVTESIDLQRCLMIPLTNEGIATRLQEWLAESTRNRYEYIAKRIDQTLQPDETGLLLINERHQVQFPTDIEVFYIAPPALDEYRRWVQNWADRQQRAAEEARARGEDVDDGGGGEEGAG